MRMVFAVLGLMVLALAGAEAADHTPHTAIVRAKDMNEAQEYASQICGNIGKRAHFMYKEAGKDGLDVYYFACK
jgi:hypothetical protein